LADKAPAGVRVSDSGVLPLRQLILFLTALAALAASASAVLVTPSPAPAGAREARGQAAASARVMKEISRHRAETWRLQRLMRRPLTRASDDVRRSRSADYRRWVLELWAKRVRALRRRAANPPRKRAWLCIQRHEARWNDSHAPYYGGLQMDLSFQRTYGFDLLVRKGTAENWSPLEQMWVAERAYRAGRGFYPWPNTARRCGLL
jgi:hypothetical protein